MAKTIWSGLESSGKSYMLAVQASILLERNYRWYKQTGVKRAIASNMKFSEEFENRAKEYGLQIIYWRHLWELILLENVDVIIEEVGNFFSARHWQELSQDVLSWLTQGAKCGVDIYGGAQDFAQVDKAFRRLVNNLYHIRKMVGSRRPSATKPPVKRIWGICLMRELDPQGYDEDKFKAISIFPSIFFIRRKYCETFDTNQKILRSKPAPYRHSVRTCPDCSFERIIHQ